MVLQAQLGRLERRELVELLAVQAQVAAQVPRDQLGQLVLRVLKDSKVAPARPVLRDRLAGQALPDTLDHRASQVIARYITVALNNFSTSFCFAMHD